MIPAFEVSVCPTVRGNTKIVLEFQLSAANVKNLAALLLVIGAKLQSRVFG